MNKMQKVSKNIIPLSRGREALSNEIVELKHIIHRMLQERIKEDRKIAIRTDLGIEILRISEILYCEASSNYTYIHTLKQRYLVSQTLKKITERIDSEEMIRCHNTYLVNKRYIRSILKHGELKIKLENEVILPMAKRKKAEVIHALAID